MTNDNSRVWHNLDWDRKVELCHQGIVKEDSLLHTYVVIFIALEAMFFAVVFSIELWWWLIVIVAVLGIGLSISFVGLFMLRGEAVDRWGEILHVLWAQVDATKVSKLEKGVLELAEHHRGSLERREKREEGGRKAVFWGWGWQGCYSGSVERREGKFGWFFRFFQRKGRLGPFRSARWVLVTLTPIVVAVGWILVIVGTILGTFDC